MALKIFSVLTKKFDSPNEKYLVIVSWENKLRPKWEVIEEDLWNSTKYNGGSKSLFFNKEAGPFNTKEEAESKMKELKDALRKRMKGTPPPP